MTRSAYRVAELAERWGCSEGHLYGLIRRGELHSFKIGTLIRVPADEVERMEGCGSLVDKGRTGVEPRREIIL